MRKTKIVCTLGPATDKDGILRQLIENGMDVARFNFSHGDHEEHRGRFEKLRALCKELDRPVAAMLDTKGPEIRLGDFKNGVENLVAGQKFTLTTRNVEGTNEIISVTYKDLPHDVQPGGRIMLDDGLIGLRIDNVTDTDITCTVENDGTIKNKKGVNVPGVHLSMPYMSQRDRSDLLFGIEMGYDLISASFTPLRSGHSGHPSPAQRARFQHAHHRQDREPGGRRQHRRDPERGRRHHGRPRRYGR